MCKEKISRRHDPIGDGSLAVHNDARTWAFPRREMGGQRRVFAVILRSVQAQKPDLHPK